MVIPTVKSLSEIVAKLKRLQTKSENIEDIPLEFPKCKGTDNRPFSIEQLVKAAGGHGPGLSKEELKSPEVVVKLTMLFSPVGTVLSRLPTLSIDKLKELLNDVIPKLLADNSVPKTEEMPESISSIGDPAGGSFFRDTEAGRNLKFIRSYVEHQIEKNIEDAKITRWAKHIQPLIDEIDRLLFPYWDYLIAYGSWRGDEKTIIESAIKSADPKGLGEVIKELEKIKYKIQVGSQQSAFNQGKFGFHPKRPSES